MKLRTRMSMLAAAAAFAVAGCQSSPKSETVGEYADDSVITAKVKTAILNDPQLKATEINVETYKGVVQLSGFVSSRDAELRATEVARSVSGVKAVNNDMRLKGDATR